MPHYRVLNLELELPFELSQVLRSPISTPDVHIKFVATAPPDCEFGTEYYSKFLGDRVIFYWPGEGFYTVIQGQSVEIFPTEPFNPKCAELALLGPILSTLLHQRQHIPFHGCAVVRQGKAQVFLGDSGLGKSTIAGYFVAQGYGYLSDDVLLFQSGPQGWEVVPCYPSMKLEKHWVDQHGFSAQPMSNIHPDFIKWQCDMREHFVSQPCPIENLTILRTGEHFRQVPLTPSQAFVELLRTTHTAKWLSGTPQALLHMEHCRELIKNIPIHLIEYPHHPKALGELQVWLDSIHRHHDCI